MLMPSAAYADASLTASPAVLEVSGDAGEVITQNVTLSAGPDQAQLVGLVHADFGFRSENYELVLIRDEAKETTAFSTRDWFSMPTKVVRIPKGKSVTIPLKISIPDNTPGGTYLGAALFRDVTPSKADGAQVRTVPETGPLVFITVSGGKPPKPQLKIKVPRLQTSGPLSPKLVMTNQGDAWFSFSGTLELDDTKGKESSTEINRQYVVPGEPRVVRTASQSKAALKLGTSELGIGRHEVTAKLRIEPTGKTLTTTRTVWIIPVWLWIAGALALILAAVGGAYAFRRWQDHRLLAAYGEAGTFSDTESDASSVDDLEEESIDEAEEDSADE
jgi:hypothetical protein